MQEELKKLRDGGIIRPTRYSSWVANLVPVRKNNCDIRLCVDFRNLNKDSMKDNYPLPNMEHMLQLVTSSELLSTLDGFSSYNKVVVKELERIETTFTTPWKSYVYVRMPFGLMNVGATFKREMDVYISGYINKFVAVYQDDVTIFSRKTGDHLLHLEKMLIRCREYGISLNLKKCHFGVEKEKLLGHIVSQEGVMIDP